MMRVLSAAAAALFGLSAIACEPPPQPRDGPLVIHDDTVRITGSTMAWSFAPASGSGDTEGPFMPSSLRVTADVMVVVDPLAQKVFVRRIEDGLVRSFGREGQGPGEFMRPSSLELHGDSVLVMDPVGGKLSWFSLDGTYARGERITAASASFGVRSDGSVVMPGAELPPEVVLIDGDGERHRWPLSRDSIDAAADGGALAFRVAERFVAVTGGDTVHAFDGVTRVLHKITPGGEVVLSRHLPDHFVREAEARAAESSGAFGNRVLYTSIVNQLAVGPDGRLFLGIETHGAMGLLIDSGTYEAWPVLRRPDASGRPRGFLSAGDHAFLLSTAGVARHGLQGGP